MRNILVFGAAAVALAVSAAGAYANGPDFSPYEIIAPQTAQPAPAPVESRAAFTAADQTQSCYPSRARIHGVWHKIQICD
jgi:hypothetical protein